jgi:anti-sigma factor RsiW
MADHLTPEQLRAYRARELSAADLLQADAHLDACSACRTALARELNAAAAAADVRASLAEITHLQFEEMEAYVDGTALPEARAMVEAHMGTCARCAREVSDLRAFTAMPSAARRDLAAASARPARQSGGLQSFLRTPAYRIGVIVAFVLIVIGVMRFSTRTPLPAVEQHLASPPRAVPTNIVPSITLKDGPRQIAIGPGAEIHGLDQFPVAYRKEISDALLAEYFRMPSAAESARARRELVSVRSSFADSHLLLGVLQLHAGNLQEARQEFLLLAQENPSSPTALDLIRKVDELQR